MRIWDGSTTPDRSLRGCGPLAPPCWRARRGIGTRKSTSFICRACARPPERQAESRQMPEKIDTITLRRPDDWHVHLRDGPMLATVLPFTARQFARAIVMPNLVPPVTDVTMARAYRDRILAALPAGVDFAPLMTCYLTDATDPGEVARGWDEKVFAAVKLYPAHATTNSASGVTDYARVLPVLERMAELGMPLLIHGELTD